MIVDSVASNLLFKIVLSVLYCGSTSIFQRFHLVEFIDTIF